ARESYSQQITTTALGRPLALVVDDRSHDRGGGVAEEMPAILEADGGLEKLDQSVARKDPRLESQPVELATVALGQLARSDPFESVDHRLGQPSLGAIFPTGQLLEEVGDRVVCQRAGVP